MPTQDNSNNTRIHMLNAKKSAIILDQKKPFPDASSNVTLVLGELVVVKKDPVDGKTMTNGCGC